MIRFLPVAAALITCLIVGVMIADSPPPIDADSVRGANLVPYILGLICGMAVGWCAAKTWHQR